MWEPGTTFTIEAPTFDHLHFAVSPTAANGDLVIANFTTLRAHGDTACVVGAGDHPWLRHESVVCYRMARVVAASFLTAKHTNGELRIWDPISEGLLERIRLGFRTSPHVPGNVLVELELHGLA